MLTNRFKCSASIFDQTKSPSSEIMESGYVCAVRGINTCKHFSKNTVLITGKSDIKYKNKNGIRLASLNVKSLYAKIDEIKLLLSDHILDIFYVLTKHF